MCQCKEYFIILCCFSFFFFNEDCIYRIFDLKDMNDNSNFRL